MMNRWLIYTRPDWPFNWFFNQYYENGTNPRYFTFQIVFNLLSQRKENPVIIETGSQWLEKGDGSSTTIFCEYISRYGGKLISIDINPNTIKTVKEWTADYQADKEFIASDSVTYLEKYQGPVDLIYLDSFHYSMDDGPNLQERRLESQEHNLKEFKAIEKQLSPSTIILLDDNFLPGGGKPTLTKDYLEQKGYICLLDFHQSIWIKEI
ncbi:class I SAM-dependent methyltransferase [Peribacillus sp. NPDC096448]|uniref:class I SAM-dependent methyltransferase n=1 Tax=Peribacillus sp. NPDC096448 TaxID=3364395 RepID=UPI00380CA11C